MKNEKGNVAAKFLIALIILITISALGYLYVKKIQLPDPSKSQMSERKDESIGLNNSTNGSGNSPTVSEADSEKPNERSVYYALNKYQPSFSVQIKEFKQDTLETVVLAEMTPSGYDFSPLGTIGNQFLFNEHNKLLAFNVSNKEFTEVLTSDPSMVIESAVVSHDKSKIAYSLYGDLKGDEKGVGEVWLYDVGTKEKRKIMNVPELEQYTKLFIQGWRANDKQLVIKEYYNGGSKIKGNIYLLDTDSLNRFEKVDLNNKKYFLKGHLNSNGEKWLFNYCGNPSEFVGEADSDEDYACEKGERLYLHSFENNEKQMLYKSRTSDSMAYGKENLNVIFSSIWQDDKNVVFATPEGIYIENIDTLEVRKAGNFEGIDPSNVKDLRIQLEYADQNRVVFKRLYAMSGIFYLDLKNGRIIEIGDDPQSSFVLNVQ